MIAGWVASKLFAPIASALVIVLGAALVFQTVRIDGFPFFGPGLRGQLAECQAQQGEANAAVLKAREDGREEGQKSAAADTAALLERDQKRDESFDKRIGELKTITADLAKPKPPVRVSVDDPLPVIVTPSQTPACVLDKAALDRLHDFVNQGRGP